MFFVKKCFPIINPQEVSEQSTHYFYKAKLMVAMLLIDYNLQYVRPYYGHHKSFFGLISIISKFPPNFFVETIGFKRKKIYNLFRVLEILVDLVLQVPVVLDLLVERKKQKKNPVESHVIRAKDLLVVQIVVNRTSSQISKVR